MDSHLSNLMYEFSTNNTKRKKYKQSIGKFLKKILEDEIEITNKFMKIYSNLLTNLCNLLPITLSKNLKD